MYVPTGNATDALVGTVILVAVAPVNLIDANLSPRARTLVVVASGVNV